MSTGHATIRSYQRLFRPERRIYQLEGRPLPVPGGVPLRWLAYAAAALLAILILGSGSPVALLLFAAAASVLGFVAGGRESAAIAAAIALAVAWLAGLALTLVDWPLRLVVAPVALATLATQASPDGRRADRFAASWLVLHLAPRRRSLGRGLPRAGLPSVSHGEIWIAREAER